MHHMIGSGNLGLITTRQQSTKLGCLCVTNTIIAHKALATYDLNSLFPLYKHPMEGQARLSQTPEPNLSREFVEAISSAIDLNFTPDGPGDLVKTIGPQDIFAYIYATLHSPEYRRRYADFLKSEFARVPLTTKVDLFVELVALGHRLTFLHLMEHQPAERLPTQPPDPTR